MKNTVNSINRMRLNQNKLNKKTQFVIFARKYLNNGLPFNTRNAWNKLYQAYSAAKNIRNRKRTRVVTGNLSANRLALAKGPRGEGNLVVVTSPGNGGNARVSFAH
jgi:hypothetical protein